MTEGKERSFLETNIRCEGFRSMQVCTIFRPKFSFAFLAVSGCAPDVEASLHGAQRLSLSLRSFESLSGEIRNKHQGNKTDSYKANKMAGVTKENLTTNVKVISLLRHATCSRGSLAEIRSKSKTGGQTMYQATRERTAHLTTTRVYVSDPSGVSSGAAISTPLLAPLAWRPCTAAASLLTKRAAAGCARALASAGDATNPAFCFKCRIHILSHCYICKREPRRANESLVEPAAISNKNPCGRSSRPLNLCLWWGKLEILW